MLLHCNNLLDTVDAKSLIGAPAAAGPALAPVSKSRARMDDGNSADAMGLSRALEAKSYEP